MIYDDSDYKFRLFKCIESIHLFVLLIFPYRIYNFEIINTKNIDL